MKVKRDHLRRRGKITLSIPPRDVPFVESLIERFPNRSFSEIVISSLKEKYGERGLLTSLGGSLKAYARERTEDMEHVLKEVAMNAAQEGPDS
ncbi:MAG: hypothetical protein DRG36_07075 [Deltaproteobacteria bacterium]|nr:MAG: hypothetical protein DRG36_07075 [Deltaproteobacteria bacterium]